ncbi:hypothetical protein HHK36_025103 [Tetracentron sinense]|uniref:Two-component response regulator n=1 Tax=Tetracentron sinense TaxID=13715 RepID=A0A834YS14_TETSI|nr:hypothetical protein HHK36_025103 [Tetracentron sinense]
MENGFSSPRIDAFPIGLRVLVVDDDPTWLKILEKMLKKCSYEGNVTYFMLLIEWGDYMFFAVVAVVVDIDLGFTEIAVVVDMTTCCLARDALNTLRQSKNGFDIIISDVNMPDMDGFKLLEHVGLEMDLPVIMMSVDGEASRVMKGVQHGACDYLLKPVRMKELQNIWQHVLRKKIHEVKDNEGHESIEDYQMMRYGSSTFDNGNMLSGGDLSSVKRRKDMVNKDHDDQDFYDDCAAKKARIVWSVDLHQKFVKAVNQIGFDKVRPKKILDLMNIPGLTRENVASHLQFIETIEVTYVNFNRLADHGNVFLVQKYRLYLSRLQTQNDSITSFGGIKQPDFSSKDPLESFGLQRSIKMPQNNFANSNFECSSNKIFVQDGSPKVHEGDLEGIVSFLPLREPKKTLTGDVPDHQKASSSPQMNLSYSLQSLRPDVNSASLESITRTQHSWSGEVPVMQFKQQPKQEHDPYTHLLLLDPQHDIQADWLQPAASISSRTSIMERDKIKPLCTENRSNHVGTVSPIGRIINSSSQAENHIVNLQALKAISTSTSRMKNHCFNQNFINNRESAEKITNLGSGSPLASSYEDLHFYSLQGDDYIENIGFQNIEFSDYNDPTHLYGGLSFNCDYLYDSMEYPIMDQVYS